jgi:glucose-6-phosphate isomerase
MKFTVDYKNANVTLDQCKNLFQKLSPEIERCKEALIQNDLDSSYAFLTIPNKDISNIQALVERKKLLNPSMIIVIGIGGSNLGTLAIQEALWGKLYNEQNPAIKIYYADTVDAEYCTTLLNIAERELQQKKTILVNVVTKSGTTTEIIANFELFLKLLIAYCPHNYRDYVVVTTDNNSVLWKIAHQEQFALLEIPQRVGGRYSVFTAVGLFPLAILGCNLEKLLEGAASTLNPCTSSSLDENYAARTACLIYDQYQKNITIQDMFLFSVQLEGLGRWYRQLMGESIGKEFDIKGNNVEVGITPTVSMGTVDLHSVGQLYLGGPRDKGTTFVSLTREKHELIIPHFEQFAKAGSQIQGKSISFIMQAILQGVKNAYRINKRPFVSIELPESSEYYIGQFLQYKMVEMVYLGYLLNVNPFDQPNVESYKEETRKILASGQ